MPDDDQPAAPASNVIPFPGKAARRSPAAAGDAGGAAHPMASAARRRAQALARPHAPRSGRCSTIKNLVALADTLADNLRALHEHRPPATPAAPDHGNADEP